jgi:acetate kinase
VSSRVLVINSGSSSLKYKLFDGTAVVAEGNLARIGEDGGDARDHADALQRVLSSVDLGGLAAVGHRVVQGGAEFEAAVLIDDKVIAAIERLSSLAPLHNPANLAGIRVARRLLPDVAQVAVFDTAFHRSMPEVAATYAIDTETAARYGVRRYGFHGTSHAYVSRETARLLGRDPADVDMITLHLGNGASACAIRGGRSIATSMGLTPLAGLVMGTRSGDVDAGALLHLHRVGGFSVDDLDTLLNQRSGLRGVAGDNDMRAIVARRAAGDPAATLAFDVYCRRIKEYVGAYLAVLGRLDAITFTAGVGENSPAVRASALAGMSGLGVEVDPDRNAGGGPVISPDGSPVTVLVVPTAEELEIAEQTRAVLA